MEYDPNPSGGRPLKPLISIIKAPGGAVAEQKIAASTIWPRNQRQSGGQHIAFADPLAANVAHQQALAPAPALLALPAAAAAQHDKQLSVKPSSKATVSVASTAVSLASHLTGTQLTRRFIQPSHHIYGLEDS